jgi:hypothetical protein
MLRIADKRQFWSGFIFFCIGIFALIRLPGYLGTASSMGPGYFPMLLGICLVMLGTGSMIFGIRSTEKLAVASIPYLPLVMILAGVLAFSFLLRPVGLAVALFFLVALGCYQRVRSHPFHVLATYLFLLALTWFVFIYVIQLPIALVPR